MDMPATERITLCVGGVAFVTTATTLLSMQNTFFCGLLNKTSGRDDIFDVFVDRDATHFRHVLNRLRGSRALPGDEGVLRELRVEADFYNMGPFVSEIDVALANVAPPLYRTLDRIQKTMMQAR